MAPNNLIGNWPAMESYKCCSRLHTLASLALTEYAIKVQSSVTQECELAHHLNFSPWCTLNASLIITIIGHDGSPPVSLHSLLMFSAMCIPFRTYFSCQTTFPSRTSKFCCRFSKNWDRRYSSIDLCHLFFWKSFGRKLYFLVCTLTFAYMINIGPTTYYFEVFFGKARMEWHDWLKSCLLSGFLVKDHLGYG